MKFIDPNLDSQATGAEDVTVVIDSAKDATTAKGETIYFQNPFGLTIHKPEPLIKYKLSSRLVSDAPLYFISNAFINYFSPFFIRYQRIIYYNKLLLDGDNQ